MSTDLSRMIIIFQNIGSLRSVGETNINREVMENLKYVEDYVLYPILGTLVENISYDGSEGSRIDIKEKSFRMLENCKEYINDMLKLYKEE